MEMEMAEKILELKNQLLAKIQEESNELSATQIREGINFFFTDKIETLPEEEFWEKYRNIKVDSLLSEYKPYIKELTGENCGV